MLSTPYTPPTKGPSRSKREFLNAFAQHLSRTGGHVVVANGFHPSFTFRDLLSSIEHVPGVLDASPSAPAPASANAGTSLDAQTQRIHAFFSAPTAPRLFLILHNIDGPVFRAPKHRAALALLEEAAGRRALARQRARARDAARRARRRGWRVLRERGQAGRVGAFVCRRACV